MRAGRLRHRIVIERQESLRDLETGAFTVSWVAFTPELDAEVVPLSGRELIAAQTTQSEITTRCVIRYMEGLDSSMRLLQQGVIYNIRAVLPDPTFSRYITLMLAAGVNDGQ